MEKCDKVGIEYIAMNVNDPLCVGATPISFFDYLAVEMLQPAVLDALGHSLCRRAKLAHVNISRGKISRLKEMIPGIHDGSRLDLAGNGIGTIALDRVVIGKDIQLGDTVMSLTSSGTQSNDLSLAWQILLKEARLAVRSHQQ